MRTVFSFMSIKRLFLVYSLQLIVGLTLMAVFDILERPNLFFLDQAFRWCGTQEPAPEIVIVGVSKEDFARGAPRWPWPRSLMARLVDQVGSYEPAVIVMDILYTERSNSESLITQEKFSEIQPHLFQAMSGVELKIQNRQGTTVIGPGSPGFDELALGAAGARKQDLELAASVARAVDQGIDVVLAAQAIGYETGLAGLAEPYTELAFASRGAIGLVGVKPDSDGVLRNYLPYGLDKDGGFVYGLALVGVARFNDIELPRTPLSNGDIPLPNGMMIHVDDGQFRVNFQGGPGTHLAVNAGDVLTGEGDFAADLKGKIVFIGVTDPSVEDMLPTPFSGTNRMAGVEFHASAADNLLNGSFLRTASGYQVILILGVFGVVAMVLGRFVRPLVGIAGAVAMLLAILGLWLGAFSWADFYLPIPAPLIAVIAGYAVSVSDRVSVEQFEKQQARSMLSRYLAPGIVKEMLRNPLAAQLGGKRADLTVLFSDIRGFTGIAERLPPEEVVALLNQYLTVMTDVVFKHGGTVDKFEGDAILAFFGAPQPHDDDPARAVRTAMEMRERLADLADEWRERTQAPLEIGIAINTGQAMVGNIGSYRRMEYTVIGDSVNLTSRLQDLTKEFGVSVLISGATYDHVKDMCQVRCLGPVEIRGRQQQVSLYEVTGLVSSDSQMVPFPEILPVM